MTKEQEFRLKHESYYNVLTGERTYNEDTVELMLSSYAKQQAIAFMRHCLEDGHLRPNDDGGVHLDWNYWHESVFTTATQELYNQFIEQQNKDNESNSSRSL